MSSAINRSTAVCIALYLHVGVGKAVFVYLLCAPPPSLLGPALS